MNRDSISILSMTFFFMALLFAALPVHAQYFNEKDGLVIIEMESTGSKRGYWRFMNRPLKGYTGKGYFQFTGNKTMSGPPKSPLAFGFKINKGGNYYLYFHCARDGNHGQPHDHSNDAYIRVLGKYSPGRITATASKKKGKKAKAGSGKSTAPMNVLMSDSKFFGGKVNEFSWGGMLDVNHKKYTAVYHFRAGQAYILVISGRSQWFNINRILFRHEDVSRQEGFDLTKPESERLRRR